MESNNFKITNSKNQNNAKGIAGLQFDECSQQSFL